MFKYNRFAAHCLYREFILYCERSENPSLIWLFSSLIFRCSFYDICARFDSHGTARLPQRCVFNRPGVCHHVKEKYHFMWCRYNWATSWQNQQNDCALSKDSDQPGHPPSLIESSLSAWRKLGSLAIHWAQSEDSDQTGLWSDWAEAQAYLSLCWAHSHFVGFVMQRLHSWYTVKIPKFWHLIKLLLS